MKHRLLYLLLAVLCIGSLVWGFYPRLSVQASDDIVSISIRANAPFVNYQDTDVTKTTRYYYLSTLIGTGTHRDPFRPLVANWTQDFGMFDLRPDVTKVDGYCIAYADGLGAPIITPGLLLLRNGVALNTDFDAKVKGDIEGLLKVSLTGATLPEILYNLAVSGEMVPAIKPQVDGKTRLYLGGQIYGEEPTPVIHTTINDTFNRANADALGTLSDSSGSWVEQTGDIDILSNKADIGGAANSYARANTADPTTANHYAQAEVTHGNNDGAGVAIRFSSSALTFYMGGSDSYSNYYAIYEVTADSWAALDTEVAGYADPTGAVYYLEGNGSSLTFKVAGVTKCTATDSSISNLDVGIAGWDANTSIWDNFEGSDLVSIAITVSPTSYDFGVVAMSSTSNTTTTYFTIDNTSGVQTDQTISVTTNTWSGGVTWAHSDTATGGANQAGLISQRGGTWGASPVIVKFSSPNYIYENAPATTDYSFGLSLVAPTSVTDGVQKAITVRVSAAAG